MKKERNQIAFNIRKIRHSLDLTQKELSEKADIPRATLANMENPAGNPAFASVVAVADALGVTLADLMESSVPSQVTKVSRENMQTFKMDDGRFLMTVLSPINAPRTTINEIVLLPGCDVKGKPHPKGFKEFFYCSGGVANVVVAGEEIEVQEGTMIYFPGNLPHIYANRSDLVARAYSIVTGA